MADRNSNRYDDNRGNDMRPQYQQDQNGGWDGSSRQTQGRGQRDEWSRDSGPGPDEFRGDRSYQNAIEEERWRGEGGGQSQFRSSDEGGNFRGGGRRFNSDIDRNDWSSDRGQGGYSGRPQMNERYRNQSGTFEGGRGGRSGEWFSGDGRSQPGDNQWRADQSQWRPGSQQGMQDRQSMQGHPGMQGQQGTQQRGGQHYGKGPKGYSRSDERIKEDLSDRMMTHPDLDASEIDIDVNQGEVTLRGSVESRQSRRLAEDLCEDCHGVRQVNNQLRVNDRAQSMSGGGRGSSESGDSATGSGRNRSDKTDKSH